MDAGPLRSADPTSVQLYPTFYLPRSPTIAGGLWVYSSGFDDIAGGIWAARQDHACRKLFKDSISRCYLSFLSLFYLPVLFSLFPAFLPCYSTDWVTWRSASRIHADKKHLVCF
jgi:hypothetical protein